MNDTATQTGAARTEPAPNPDVKPDEIETRPNPREVALAAMGERQEQVRREEIADAIAADPDLAAAQQRIDGAIAESNAAAGIVHDEDVPTYSGNIGSDGAASAQPMRQPEPEPARPDLPSNLQDDPLADFIVMDGNKPMVKAKVNGTDRLVPLADAKRQVQIGLAAEVRMQNAAQAEKILNERERRLSAGEAALQARMNVAASQPATPEPAAEGLSDEELLAEATDIFNTAFSGTEEDAATKLAGTLVKIRNSAVRPVPTPIPVDEEAIANRAASIATGALTAQSRKKDVAEGYKDFKSNYPEILTDPHLFRMADDMTDSIEQENPDWNIAQVMDEAGKRTRAWVKGLRGETEDTGDTPPPQPENKSIPVSDQTTQTRQERKAGLVQMPSQAGAATYSEPEPEDENEQTPLDAFAELKRSRGQPY